MSVCTTNWNIARIYLEGMLIIGKSKDDITRIEAMLKVVTALADAKEKLKDAMDDEDMMDVAEKMIKRN